ncbi:DUF4019 domain-containing protein [Trinickia sp. YCB016]
MKLTVAGALACTAGLAIADPGASADELLHDADDVLQQIDVGHFGDVWSDAAPFVKAKIPKEQFMTQTAAARLALGAVAKRGWASIVRIRFTNTVGLPDGLYANVDYSTTLADGGTVYELLSFRLESDGQWHLTGYVPRRSQGQIGQAGTVATP